MRLQQRFTKDSRAVPQPKSDHRQLTYNQLSPTKPTIPNKAEPLSGIPAENCDKEISRSNTTESLGANWHPGECKSITLMNRATDTGHVTTKRDLALDMFEHHLKWRNQFIAEKEAKRKRKRQTVEVFPASLQRGPECSA